MPDPKPPSNLKDLSVEQVQALVDAYKRASTAAGAMSAEQLKHLKLLEEAVEAAERRREVDIERRTLLKAEITDLKDRAQAEKSGILQQELLKQIKEAQNESDKIALKLLREKIIEEEDLSDEEKKRLARKEKEKELDKKRNESLAEAKALASDIGSVWTKIGKDYSAHPFFNVKSFLRIGSAFKNPVEFFKTLGTTALSSFVDSMIGLAFSMDQARADFERTTGATESQTRAMLKSAAAARRFNVSAEETAKINTSLRDGFTDFTMLSTDMQQSITDTGVMLKAYGNISDQALSQGMQTATKYLGETPEMARKSMMSIAAYAKDLGVEPGKLTEQFGKMGPQLAKFGDQGGKAFKDLARISKITGMEMTKILSITDKFDTFEEAAKRTGLLNAALGGNFVNAMDMMMDTDPAARFEMIRDAIAQTGLSFDDMSYYQKNFYKEALGLDSVGDLALLMAGNFDALDENLGKTSDDYKDMAEQAEIMMSLQESFNSLLAELVPILQPMLDEFRAWLMEIKSNDEELDKLKATLQGVADALIFVVKHFKPLILIFLLGPTLIAPFIGLVFSLIGAITGLGSGLLGLGGALGGAGAAAAPSLPVLFGFSLMILAIGAAIMMATEGFAALVLSFKDIGDNGEAAADAIWKFTAAFGAMLALMVIFGGGPQALAVGVGVGTILAVGAAAIAMGLGLSLGAEGFATFMNEMKPEAWANIDKGALAIVKFAGAIALLAGALALMGLPLPVAGAITLGIAALGISTMLMALDEFMSPDVEPMVEVLGSLAAISEGGGMGAIETSMNNIIAKIDNMDEGNADALASALRATSHAQTIAHAFGFRAPTGGGGSSTGATGATPSTPATQYITIELNLDGDIVAGKTVKIFGDLVSDATLGTTRVIAQPA
jgi:hypothetical protein